MLARLFVLGLICLAAQSQARKDLVPYSWEYQGVVHGTIQVPPGFKAETNNYREGIITHLRYPDSSYIVLQHGGMYRVPMFQDSEYVIKRTEELSDRTIRTGAIKGSEKLWREDNLKKMPSSGGDLHPLFYFFPPNIAYDKVPQNRVEFFNDALDSFDWKTKP